MWWLNFWVCFVVALSPNVPTLARIAFGVFALHSFLRVIKVMASPRG